MRKGRRPPPALAGCRVEQFAIRTRTVRFSGSSNLYVDGKELGPVPRLAIGRAEEGVNLFHCDGRWNVLGCAGPYATVTEAKQRAERIYPGISGLWEKTPFSSADVRRYLDESGHNLKCSFCGKFWHEVQRMITRKNHDVAICDGCVRQMTPLVRDTPSS